MKNIFEGAYFSKPYKTRDGRKAILISYNQRKPSAPYVCAVACYLDNSIKSNCYNFNEFGKRGIDISTYDIVSEWQESINEEELEKLANEYADNVEMTGTSSDGYYTGCWDYLDIVKAFKAGYRKAKGYE